MIRLYKDTCTYSWMTAFFLATLWLFGLTYGALAADDKSIPPVEFTILDGETIALDDLSQGNWVLAFVILPDCPACEGVIEWFAQGEQAFPQINFLLVTPAATPELVAFVEEQAAGLRVLFDSDGSIGGRLGVTRAPTVFLTMDGIHIDRLDWPFTQQQVLQALEESISVEFVFPHPSELFGQPAPEFVATDLAGTKIALTDLPQPLLLSFFNPNCPPCWDILPALVEASTEVSVVMLAVVGEEGLAYQHRARFAESGAEAGKMTILLLTDFQVIDAYQVTATSTTFLINRKGVITWIALGDTAGLVEALGTVHGERRYEGH